MESLGDSPFRGEICTFSFLIARLRSLPSQPDVQGTTFQNTSRLVLCVYVTFDHAPWLFTHNFGQNLLIGWRQQPKESEIIIIQSCLTFLYLSEVSYFVSRDNVLKSIPIVMALWW